MLNDDVEMSMVDLTGEDPVLAGDADLTGSDRPVAMPGLASLPARVPLLTVCRESNEYDTVLLQGLVQQTLSYLGERDSVPVARELGIRPLVEDCHTPGVTVTQVPHGRARAVLIEILGDYYLYSMASAAKRNTVGDNDWTQLCAGVLRALRPVQLQVASLSRLVRSFEHSAVLLDAVNKNVDIVRSGSQVIPMRGEGSDYGQIMWTVLAMVAASERNLIVQRLTAGMVAKYRRGEWLKGLSAVPLGYRYDPDTRRLLVDPGQTRALRLAWTWMADPAVPAWQITQRLGDLGMSTPTVRKRHGDHGTVADLKEPETYLNQLRRWAHLYRTGVHTTRWRNPFDGAQHIAGMPVHRTPEREELRFTYQLGRPDLDTALIEAGLRGRTVRPAVAPRGGAARDELPALSQVSWQQDGLLHWLVSGVDDTYELRIGARQEA